MTAWLTPASFSRLINLPSWPSEIQWNAAAGGLAAASASSGKVSSLRPTTVTSWPARGAPQDHAALRGADEVDQVLHLGAGQRLVLFDLLQRPRRIELRLQEIPERALDLGDDVLGEAAPHQPDGVGAVNPRRPAADGARIRQRVLGHHRVAADERVPPDPAEL